MRTALRVFLLLGGSAHHRSNNLAAADSAGNPLEYPTWTTVRVVFLYPTETGPRPYRNLRRSVRGLQTTEMHAAHQVWVSRHLANGGPPPWRTPSRDRKQDDFRAGEGCGSASAFSRRTGSGAVSAAGTRCGPRDGVAPFVLCEDSAELTAACGSKGNEKK